MSLVPRYHHLYGPLRPVRVAEDAAPMPRYGDRSARHSVFSTVPTGRHHTRQIALIRGQRECMLSVSFWVGGELVGRRQIPASQIHLALDAIAAARGSGGEVQIGMIGTRAGSLLITARPGAVILTVRDGRGIPKGMATVLEGAELDAFAKATRAISEGRR